MPTTEPIVSDPRDYRAFLVPYDFSSHAQAALYAACDLAKRLGADLHLVHVVQFPPYALGYGPYTAGAPPLPLEMDEARDSAMKSLREVIDGIEDPPGKLEPHVVGGHNVAALLLEMAERLGADLIVMGTHGRTGLAHVFLGSVAERTLRRAPCAVLTVQSPEEQS